MNDDKLRVAADVATPAAEARHAGLDHPAFGWAWDQPIANNAGARIVLLSLACMVDDAWECAATQEEIAAAALLPARSVRRYMEQLEDSGHIERHKRYDGKGHRLSDQCRLNPSAALSAKLDGKQVSPVANLDAGEDAYRPDYPLANLASGPEQGERLPANLDSGQSGLWGDWPTAAPDETDIPWSEPVANLATGQIGRASSSPTENYNNKPTSIKKRSRAQASDEEHPRFAEWYAVYPLHTKRPLAVKAFNKALTKVADVQILIDAAERYAKYDRRVRDGFPMGPAVWLNNDCWDDDIQKPNTRATGTDGRTSNGSGAQVPPRGTRQKTPFRSKRETA